MSTFIFTAVLTACLGIGGYLPGPAVFGPNPERLGGYQYKYPAQLNSSSSGPWASLVYPHSTTSLAVYTSLYYVLTYFAGSFGQYNAPAKVFQWLMTIYSFATALTGFQISSLLPYIL